MRYIVLLSNGYFNHDFVLKETKEKAEKTAQHFRNVGAYKTVIVAELTEEVEL